MNQVIPVSMASQTTTKPRNEKDALGEKQDFNQLLVDGNAAVMPYVLFQTEAPTQTVRFLAQETPVQMLPTQAGQAVIPMQEMASTTTPVQTAVPMQEMASPATPVPVQTAVPMQEMASTATPVQTAAVPMQEMTSTATPVAPTQAVSTQAVPTVVPTAAVPMQEMAVPATPVQTAPVQTTPVQTTPVQTAGVPRQEAATQAVAVQEEAPAPVVSTNASEVPQAQEIQPETKKESSSKEGTSEENASKENASKENQTWSHMASGLQEGTQASRYTQEMPQVTGKETLSQATKQEEVNQKNLTDLLLKNVAAGKQEFELQLEPLHLGKLAIKISYEAGKTAVSILCSSAKTLEAMAQNARDIGDILEARLGIQTEIVLDKSEPDYLDEQQSKQQEQQGKEDQADTSSGKKEYEENEYADFLQQLRLGLVG